MQQRDRLIVMFAVFVAALCFVFILSRVTAGRSLTAAGGPVPGSPGVPLPCGHPLGRFDKDAGAMQTGMGSCIHGHSYLWTLGQWKVDPLATLGGREGEHSPNAPR